MNSNNPSIMSLMPSVYVIAGIHKHTKLFRVSVIENFEATIQDGNLAFQEDYSRLSKLAKSWFDDTKGFCIACIPREELQDYVDTKKLEHSTPVLEELQILLMKVKERKSTSREPLEISEEEIKEKRIKVKNLRAEIARITARREKLRKSRKLQWSY